MASKAELLEQAKALGVEVPADAKYADIKKALAAAKPQEEVKEAPVEGSFDERTRETQPWRQANDENLDRDRQIAEERAAELNK